MVKWALKIIVAEVLEFIFKKLHKYAKVTAVRKQQRQIASQMLEYLRDTDALLSKEEREKITKDIARGSF